MISLVFKRSCGHTVPVFVDEDFWDASTGVGNTITAGRSPYLIRCEEMNDTHAYTVSEGKHPGRSRVTGLGARNELTFVNTAAIAYGQKNRLEPQDFCGMQ